jgi:hypothetical protein
MSTTNEHPVQWARPVTPGRDYAATAAAVTVPELAHLAHMRIGELRRSLHEAGLTPIGRLPRKGQSLWDGPSARAHIATLDGATR